MKTLPLQIIRALLPPSYGTEEREKYARNAQRIYRKNLKNPGDAEGDFPLLAGLAIAQAEIGIFPGWIPEVQKAGCAYADRITRDKLFTWHEMEMQIRGLLLDLKPEIHRDYRASEEDTRAGMQVTVSTRDGSAWHYQTGDNSYSGACYGDPHWSVIYLYPDSHCGDLARSAVEELAEAVHSTGNAGCDKCGMNDRAPGSEFCTACTEVESEETEPCDTCMCMVPESEISHTEDGKTVCHNCAS